MKAMLISTIVIMNLAALEEAILLKSASGHAKTKWKGKN
jgi:hypothetical protein